MAATNKKARSRDLRKHRAERSLERRMRAKNTVPTSPDGMPGGKHLSGFKGTKVDALCLCGKCHPNAKENNGRSRYI